CHCRTNVPWKTVQYAAYVPFFGISRFYHQVLLAVVGNLSIGYLWKGNRRMFFHFRSNGFVTQIEAKQIWTGLAYNPCKKSNCYIKLKVGKAFTISPIPKQRGSGR